MPRQLPLRAGSGRGWFGLGVLAAALVVIAGPASADIGTVQPASAGVTAGGSVQATVSVDSASGACLSALTVDSSVTVTFEPVCGSGAWASVLTVQTTAQTLQASHLVTITETPNLIGLPDVGFFSVTVTAPTTTTTSTTAAPTPTTTTTPTSIPGGSSTSTTVGAAPPPSTTPTTSAAGVLLPGTQSPEESTTTTVRDDGDEASAVSPPHGTTTTVIGDTVVAQSPDGSLAEAATGLFEGSASDRAERLATSPWLILTSLFAAMAATGAALVPFLVALIVLAALAYYRYLQTRRASP